MKRASLVVLIVIRRGVGEQDAYVKMIDHELARIARTTRPAPVVAD
jgi:hypothetical protein